MSTERKSLYEFEKFCCDRGEHLLFGDGKSISQASKAFEILVVLIESLLYAFSITSMSEGQSPDDM